jgi:excisionase family DNA binding protein
MSPNRSVTLSGMISDSAVPAGTPLEPLPSIEETQQLFGVSRQTVLRLLDAGELVRVRVRGRVLVDPASIRGYIARHREDSD